MFLKDKENNFGRETVQVYAGVYAGRFACYVVG